MAAMYEEETLELELDGELELELEAPTLRELEFWRAALDVIVAAGRFADAKFWFTVLELSKFTAVAAELAFGILIVTSTPTPLESSTRRCTE